MISPVSELCEFSDYVNSVLLLVVSNKKFKENSVLSTVACGTAMREWDTLYTAGVYKSVYNGFQIMHNVAQSCARQGRKLCTCVVQNSAFPGPVQASARLVNKLVHYLYTSVHKAVRNSRTWYQNAV